jgi:plastocyanin
MECPLVPSILRSVDAPRSSTHTAGRADEGRPIAPPAAPVASCERWMSARLRPDEPRWQCLSGRNHHREEVEMTFRNVVALSAAVFALAGVGTAEAAPAAARATTVKVTAKDYSFQLSTNKVKPGAVMFEISNRGKTAHDFAIDGHHSKTLEPGKSARLEVKLSPGRYPYTCTVDSHAKLGMKGVLVVKA